MNNSVTPQQRKVIALGDPGHTTVLLSSNFVPLNIGFIAAYLNKKFPGQLDIHLFKDPEELHDFAINHQPDLMAMSNYAWNQALSLHILRDFKNVNPNGVSIMGGPNFPKDHNRAQDWLQDHPHIDFVVENEGETSMEALVGRLLENDFSLEAAKRTPVSGSFFLNADNTLSHAPFVMLQDLDEIPSPYLEGWFDKFLLNDVQGFTLLPMIEGSRGCPFACTFCRAGIETNKMRNFSLERMCAEIEYITNLLKEHKRPGSVLLITDQNFGIQRRDIKVAEQLQKSLDETGYPSKVLTTTGKTNVESVLETMDRYEGFAMSLAVQSLDEDVLSRIKRKNFPVDKFMGYQKTLEEQKKPSRSDIIVALPGETFESHLNTLRGLFKIGISEVDPFTHMMLLGTESEMPECRAEYEFVTKWRLLPGGYSSFGEDRIFESEEVVIATNTMSFDEYVKSRKLHLLFTIVFNGSVFREISKLIRETESDPVDFLLMLASKLSGTEDTNPIAKIVGEFEHKTRAELFESRETLNAFYGKDENYQKLLDGEIGENLIQVHRLKLFMKLGQFTHNLLSVLREFLEPTGKLDEIEASGLFEFVQKRADCFEHLVTKNQMETDNALEVYLDFDVSAWVGEKDKSISDFKLSDKLKFELYYPSELKEEFDNLFKTDRNNISDKARVLYRFGVDRLLPTVMQNSA